ESAYLIANLNCLPLDFVARQKVGGLHLVHSIMKQLPILPPGYYTDVNLDFVVPRVLQLTYTADDMAPFAKDAGYEGPPFKWDVKRRAIVRAELDSYYAYLYGLTRRELEYI